MLREFSGRGLRVVEVHQHDLVVCPTSSRRCAASVRGSILHTLDDFSVASKRSQLVALKTAPTWHRGPQEKRAYSTRRAIAAHDARDSSATTRSTTDDDERIPGTHGRKNLFCFVFSAPSFP